MPDGQSIAADLASVMGEIGALVAGCSAPPPATLERVAQLLEDFAGRHRATLDATAFPLPAAAGDALCSYDLSDEGARPTLRVNAIRGGVDSAIHDHGTWAVIVALHGRECNRIHARAAAAGPQALPVLQGETWVEPGRPLALPAGQFHSIHTAADAPTWQLHLYGQAPEDVARQLVDPVSGSLRFLGPADRGD